MGYYDTPPQEVFDDIKKNAAEIRKGYDDTFGYATEKLRIIDHIENYKDNRAYIIAMFDTENTAKLQGLLKDETNKYILANKS